MIADKELVVKLIEGSEYYITIPELNEHFDSRSRESLGQALEESINLLQEELSEEYQVMAQHLTLEYLKYFDLTEEEEKEIADLFILTVEMLDI